MKRLSIFVILIVIFIGSIFPNVFVHANLVDNNFLSIKLTSPIKSTEFVNLYSEEGFFIFYKDDLSQEVESIDIDSIKISLGEKDEIIISDNEDNLLFTYNQEDDLIISSKDEFDRRIKIEDRYYRDYVYFKIVGGKLITLNYVQIENYLYGVVPMEMPTSFEMEALKAQAIAARTYTLKNINKHIGEGYDLCDTTHCQVYGGMDGEQEKTNRAVEETYGMIITYNGDIIDALYHSNSGGVTEDSMEAWGNSHPYLIAVDDNFSSEAPNSSWSLNLTSDEINRRLNNSGINIGDVVDMEIIETSSNGRVTQLKIVGTLSEKLLSKGQIREILGTTELKSTWFTIQKDSSVETITNLYVIDSSNTNPQLININTAYVIDGSFRKNPSRGLTSRYVNRDTNFDNSKGTSYTNTDFIIEGKGYGHGVGMSQWGAQKMAELGYSFEDILMHYYSGVEIIIND